MWHLQRYTWQRSLLRLSIKFGMYSKMLEDYDLDFQLWGEFLNVKLSSNDEILWKPDFNVWCILWVFLGHMWQTSRGENCYSPSLWQILLEIPYNILGIVWIKCHYLYEQPSTFHFTSLSSCFKVSHCICLPNAEEQMIQNTFNVFLSCRTKTAYKHQL